MHDLLITNARIIDGSRSGAYPGSLAIRGDRIAAVGDLAGAEANRIIDAAGRVVAPGFVDVHNHSDGWLLNTPHLFPKTSQGFTTEILMADGISYAPVNVRTAREWMFYLRPLNGLRLDEYRGWETIGDYLELLDGRTVQNVAAHVPYANVRTLAMGFGRRAPDDTEIELMKAHVRFGMEEGAVGVSTGLDYISQCFADTDEIAEVCAAMAGLSGQAEPGLYVTHVRYKKGTLQGVKEAVEIGKRAKVPVHISHLKGRDAKEADALLDYIDRVAVHEVDFSFDVYPYLPSSTLLNYLLPYEAWEDGPLSAPAKLNCPRLRERFEARLNSYKLDQLQIAWLPGNDNRRWIGKTIADYVAATDKSTVEAVCDLLIEERLAVLLVFRLSPNDRLVEPFVRHEKYMIGSDGIYFADGAVHPRMYGSAPRLLGDFVRRGVLSLEEAVYKLSAYPAERFGLKKRGRIAEGYYADLVLFDPATVSDPATFDAPHRTATGIDTVFVNGVPIVNAGRPVDNLPSPLPGRYLRFRQE
jgi:N-acyl-D-amino-acid deacylase